MAHKKSIANQGRPKQSNKGRAHSSSLPSPPPTSKQHQGVKNRSSQPKLKNASNASTPSHPSLANGTVIASAINISGRQKSSSTTTTLHQTKKPLNEESNRHIQDLWTRKYRHLEPVKLTKTDGISTRESSGSSKKTDHHSTSTELHNGTGYRSQSNYKNYFGRDRKTREKKLREEIVSVFDQKVRGTGNFTFAGCSDFKLIVNQFKDGYVVNKGRGSYPEQYSNTASHKRRIDEHHKFSKNDEKFINKWRRKINNIHHYDGSASNISQAFGKMYDEYFRGGILKAFKSKEMVIRDYSKFLDISNLLLRELMDKVIQN